LIIIADITKIFIGSEPKVMAKEKAPGFIKASEVNSRLRGEALY
jgi:hypothetical protein